MSDINPGQPEESSPGPANSPDDHASGVARVSPEYAELAKRREVAPISVIADRAAGVLLAQACGDALGVPYEFQSPGAQGTPYMTGGGMGPYRPGEWSDDTQMSICIAEVAVTGVDLSSEAALDQVALRYLAWAHSGASDIDSQTHVVLEAAAADSGRERPSRKLRSAAFAHHRRTGRSASNSALVRSGVVGLCRLHDRKATAKAVRALAALTHYDTLAGDACVLWAEAIRRAVLSPVLGDDNWAKRINPGAGLDLLPPVRRQQWAEWIHDGRRLYFAPPRDNTFTVTAFQAAIGAITGASLEDGPEAPHGPIRAALENAVRVGGDTDTVAAITGALMGAACGGRAVPKEWAGSVHGWPGLRADGLQDLAVGTALAGFVGEAGMSGAIAAGFDLRALTGLS